MLLGSADAAVVAIGAAVAAAATVGAAEAVVIAAIKVQNGIRIASYCFT